MEQVKIGAPVNKSVKIHRRRAVKRISLRISRLDRSIRVTAPPHVPLATIRSFLEERSDWVSDHLARLPKLQKIEEGMIFPVDGKFYRVILTDQTRVCEVFGDELHVPSVKPGRSLASFLKNRAGSAFERACEYYADCLGEHYTKITLRDTKSRWGSCTSGGRLMFSWRLAMAPPSVLEYVAAHEVAHLREMNHSDAFWQLVEQLFPNWQDARNWLRTEGEDLHYFRFTD